MKHTGLKIGFFFSLVMTGFLLYNIERVKEKYYRYIRSLDPSSYEGRAALFKKIKPDSFELLISDKNVKKLSEQRKLALDVGIRYMSHPEFTGYVKGKLVFNGDTSKIKLRQKGLFPDHYEDSLKCSYKIVMKGDNTFRGMKKFAIQKPGTREWMNEWYLHKLFSYINIIHLRYGFANVVINGRNSGIYAVEENMHKNLIENNHLEEGPIFRFDIDGGKESTPMFFKPIKPYNKKRLKSDSVLQSQYQHAKGLLSDFREGTKKSSEVFDVEKMAKFYALIDLTGHHHASHPHNLKFYYNPVSGFIEPIGYDNNDIYPLEKEGLLGALKNVNAPVKNRGELAYQNDPLSEQLFNDEVFFKKYIKYLIEFSDKSWLDNFFTSVDKIADRQTQIIWTTYYGYRFMYKSVFYHNQEIIKQMLETSRKPEVKENAVFQSKGINNILIRNLNELPLIIISVSANDIIISDQNILLQPNYGFSESMKYDSIKLKCEIKDKMNVVIKYKYLGMDIIHTNDYDLSLHD